jgi:hypothetical protein
MPADGIESPATTRYNHDPISRFQNTTGEERRPATASSKRPVTTSGQIQYVA